MEPSIDFSPTLIAWSASIVVVAFVAPIMAAKLVILGIEWWARKKTPRAVRPEAKQVIDRRSVSRSEASGGRSGRGS